MTDRKRPLDQALDLVVYAPIGFALEARRLLPSFVDRGRSQVQMTRMIGRFAVQQGQQVAEKRLAKVQDRADAVLGDFARRGDGATAAVDETGPIAADATANGPVAAATAQSGAGAAELAIPDYDSLAASQVIPRLEALSAVELADVARYEQEHRARKTILGKISQLQAG